VSYQQGDIIWVKFPFSDNPAQFKPRPALIVSNESSNVIDHDYIVVQITSVLRGDIFSVALTSEMVLTSLPKASEIRCNKLATVRDKLILGRLTSLRPGFLSAILDKVHQVFHPA